MIIKSKKYKVFLFFILILFGINSCTKPIKVVLKKARKLNGKKIRIKGSVISSIQLVDIKCFTIKDKTGKICIVTNNLLPLKRDFIRISGVLNTSYQYKKKQMLVIEEKQIKLKKIKIPSKREVKKNNKIKY